MIAPLETLPEEGAEETAGLLIAPRDAIQDALLQEAVAKVTALTFEYNGTQVVEASDLHKSAVLPELFKNLTKTPRKAVRLRMTRNVDFFMVQRIFTVAELRAMAVSFPKPLLLLSPQLCQQLTI